ncbi:MAG: class 1 fructose-bisphosphatase [Alphaproteobacteria bacterium]|nr:MAG: class 1 fructose-bisphosphatase [Alphaproteobacteria bacterium]
MTQLPDLSTWLSTRSVAPPTRDAVLCIAAACVEIGRVVALGAIEDNLGVAGGINVQQEEQKKLDVLSNDILSDALLACPSVAGLASEELDTVQVTDRTGGVLVTFDPLDGSSNLDINAPGGTIVSILPAAEGRVSTEADFLRPGRDQLAAGYALYGPQTVLVLSVDRDVASFTLDAGGHWRLTHDRLVVPEQTKEFAINMSNRRHWAPAVRAYIDDCLAGRDGPRGKDFNMRWVAAMVGDVHRILTRGGVFLYPWDAREPDRPGKLRLLYEGAPMALLIERAGGLATDGTQAILDIVPTALHQRVAIVLGSAEEVRLAG